MKHLIILGDGMADEPIDSLNGKTPLQAAKTPYMDMLASKGRCGTLSTVPDGFAPGSEIANLTLLGYDVSSEFEGRGSLEAASIGVTLLPGEMAMRCNLITIEKGVIKNHSAGHISTEEAGELIEYLNEKLGDGSIKFYKGVAYRHLLVVKGGNKEISCTPPHDVPGSPYSEVMIKSDIPDAKTTVQMLNYLILKSQEILNTHPINLKRISLGKDPANSIWPWSPGYKPTMKTIPEKYSTVKSGSVISAVDLIKGIGIYAGLESISVQGATGLYTTNYEGKASAAINELKKKDFVFLHLEASDEASHEGDVELKIKTIEYLDSRVIGPIYEQIKDWEEMVSIAILPDHPTFCRTRTHDRGSVPVIIYNPYIKPDSVDVFDEFSVKVGELGAMKGDDFMREFLL